MQGEGGKIQWANEGMKVGLRETKPWGSRDGSRREWEKYLVIYGCKEDLG